MNTRIVELDFVKGVLITLMVLCHLSLFVMTYKSIVSWVYCFHMSGFLLVSGYLQKVKENKLGGVKRAIRRIVLPYMIFEGIYLVAIALLGSFLGSSNHSGLTLASLLERIFVAPIGTYWYLHTLFLCVMVSYFSSLFRLNGFNTLLITGCILFILTTLIKGLHWENVMYFIFGSFIQRLNFKFNEFVIPTIFSLVPVALISIFAMNLDRSTLSGVGLTFCMVSLLMGMFFYMPKFIKYIFVFLGKNSFALLLFSPIFSILTKQYISFFSFDSTHFLWTFLSLCLVIGLSLLLAFVCDKMRISRFIMGANLYLKYSEIRKDS